MYSWCLCPVTETYSTYCYFCPVGWCYENLFPSDPIFFSFKSSVTSIGDKTFAVSMFSPECQWRMCWIRRTLVWTEYCVGLLLETCLLEQLWTSCARTKENIDRRTREWDAPFKTAMWDLIQTPKMGNLLTAPPHALLVTYSNFTVEGIPKYCNTHQNLLNIFIVLCMWWLSS